MLWLKGGKKKEKISPNHCSSQSMVLGKCGWKKDLLTEGLLGDECRGGELFESQKLLALLSPFCIFHITIQLDENQSNIILFYVHTQHNFTSFQMHIKEKG